jgi:hypothetical protein
MSRALITELFVEDIHLDPDRVGDVLGELVRSGFAYQPSDGSPVPYAVDTVWTDGDISEATGAFERSRDWAIQLRKETATTEPVDLVLSITKPSSLESTRLYDVSLSTDLPFRRSMPIVSQEFASWSTFIAELTHPTYGWGGSSLGLLGRETVPVSRKEVSTFEPQPIEWLNIFGPPYVNRLGLDRILSIGIGQVRFLCDGSLVVLLSRHPDDISIRDAVRGAKHLGLPPPNL